MVKIKSSKKTLDKKIRNTNVAYSAEIANWIYEQQTLLHDQ